MKNPYADSLAHTTWECKYILYLHPNLEEKKYKIAFYCGSKAFVESVAPKILSRFGIEQAEIINGELKWE